MRNIVEIQSARQRVEKAEMELDTLEEAREKGGDMDPDEEMELLEKIKAHHEVLEAERRIFEDLEFHKMEEEAGMEADMEDVSIMINKTAGELDLAETTVCEMEHQKLEMSINQDISILEEKRESVASKLEAEKAKLSDLEQKLRELMAATTSNRSSEDSGTITWSDEDTVKLQVFTN